MAKFICRTARWLLISSTVADSMILHRYRMPTEEFVLISIWKIGFEVVNALQLKQPHLLSVIRRSVPNCRTAFLTAPVLLPKFHTPANKLLNFNSVQLSDRSFWLYWRKMFLLIVDSWVQIALHSRLMPLALPSPKPLDSSWRGLFLSLCRQVR